jgi:hypothetical protein
MFADPHPAALPAAGAASKARLQAAVEWHDEELDACVLRITDEAWKPLSSGSFLRWWWGRIIGDSPVNVRAIGFPHAARREGRLTRHEMLGRITPATGAKGNTFAVQVTNEKPVELGPGLGSPWAGMSGAAVFAGPYLVAMLAKDPANWEAERLDALRVERLLMAPGFTGRWEDEGLPEAEAVLATTAGTAVPSVLSAFEKGLERELAKIQSPHVYRDIARVLGFGENMLPDEQSTPILAKEIVANATAVLDQVKDEIAQVARSGAGLIYRWVAPLGWDPPLPASELRKSLELTARPRVVAVGARQLTTLEALVRHTGGLFNDLPEGWHMTRFKWPEGEQAPSAVAAALQRAVEDALGISADDDGFVDDDDDGEEPEVARRAGKGAVFMTMPPPVQLSAVLRQAIAASAPWPVLLCRVPRKRLGMVGDDLPGATVLDLGLDPEVETTFHDVCLELDQSGF